jgi:hypothetical protein
LRWRQGQALRVLRNLDPAGRGRMIESAGSEGMPLSPHQGNRSAKLFPNHFPTDEPNICFATNAGTHQTSDRKIFRSM